ncbi:MAG: class I SAM-dependent methyltransferase [Anaerolineales bacterium]
MPERVAESVPSVLYDEDYFLKACEGYSEFVSSEGEYLSRRLSEALAVAGIAPGMQVLDVGCGRGELLRHVHRLGARPFGIDYATVAVRMARAVVDRETEGGAEIGVYRANAQQLPFVQASFDRVLMLDIVEHLYPEELERALQDAARVLRPGGRIVLHTAPNVWYDRYAYPLVRLVRRLLGQGQGYPADPRAFLVPENVHVHVNEQSLLSLRRNLRGAGFIRIQSWLSTPPQNRQEHALFGMARKVLFRAPPFRWFFQREVFAVGERPG